MENYSALTPLHKKFDVILSKTFFTVKSYSVFTAAVLTLQNTHNFTYTIFFVITEFQHQKTNGELFFFNQYLMQIRNAYKWSNLNSIKKEQKPKKILIQRRKNGIN